MGGDGADYWPHPSIARPYRRAWPPDRRGWQIWWQHGWGAQLGGEISRKLHLHARYLKFRHPFSKRDLTLTAALPDHMARTWDLFDWRAEDVPVDPFYDELG